MTLSRVTCTARGGGAFLDVTRFAVTLSDQWSPYIQGQLVCALPPGPVVDALDPRQAVAPHVDVRLVQDFGEGKSVAAWPGSMAALSGSMAAFPRMPGFDGTDRAAQELPLRLYVDEYTEDAATGLLTVELGGRELRLQDWVQPSGELDMSAWLIPPRARTVTGHDAARIVSRILATALHHAPGSGLAPSPYYSHPFGSITIEEGQSAWAAIDAILAPQDLRLLCDEHGAWRIIDRRETRPQAPVTVAGLLSATRTVSRRDWHDALYAVEATTTEDDRIVGATSTRWGPDLAAATKPLFVARFPNRGDVPIRLGSGFRSPFARWHGKGEAHAWVAPLALDLRPLDQITVTDRRGTREVTVTTVTHSIPDCKTTITTRESEDT